MKYIVYIRIGKKHSSKKFKTIEEGQEYFDSVRNYDYKELAIDGRRGYTVVRCLYKL